VGEIRISWGVLTILGYPCDSLEFIEHVWRFYWQRHRLLGTNFSPVRNSFPLPPPTWTAPASSPLSLVSPRLFSPHTQGRVASPV